MQKLAISNAQGDYVVNLGTQQFTVLTLWDKWVSGSHPDWHSRFLVFSLIGKNTSSD